MAASVAEAAAEVGLEADGEETMKSQPMHIHIDTIHPHTRPKQEDRPLYQIFLLSGPVEAVVDFTSYQTISTSLLFLSPYQHLEWKKAASQPA